MALGHRKDQARMPLGISKNLSQRIISAVSLLPLVLGAVYMGGWWFASLLILGGVLMASEWVKLTISNSRVLGVGLSLLISMMVIWTEYNSPDAGELLANLLIIFLAGALIVRLLPFKTLGWLLIGAGYVLLPLVAMWWLRTQDAWWVIWVFLIVWGTDIGGYFAGKGIGGPKLAPKLSPKNMVRSRGWRGFEHGG